MYESTSREYLEYRFSELSSRIKKQGFGSARHTVSLKTYMYKREYIGLRGVKNAIFDGREGVEAKSSRERKDYGDVN